MAGASLLPYMSRQPPFSIELPSDAPVKGETTVRRNIKCQNGLISNPDPTVHTVYDVIQYSARKYGDADCIGERAVVKTHKEKKMVKKVVDGKNTEVEKEWTYFELGPFKFLSYAEFRDHIGHLGSGLKELGLGKGDRILIYGATSLPWLSIAQGAFTQSLSVVTAYDTLGLEGLRTSLAQTQSKAIFVDSTLVSMLNKALDAAPAIQTIILKDAAQADKVQLDQLAQSFPKLRVISYEDLKQLGEDNPAEHVPPHRDDLACIMYTSGTSGPPKGVTILHKAVVAGMTGAADCVGNHVKHGDGMLAYLPLAHIIEFVFENWAIFAGVKLGYGSPKTLTDASVRNCKGDIAEFRPSAIVGVPAVWELIKKGIIGKVTASGFIKRNLFWGALMAKQALLAAGLPGSGLIDSVVFAPIRAATGGRIKLGMNGGGPISRETQVFMSMILAPIINGYGMTETNGMGALTYPDAWTPDAHGEIPVSVEEKLVDFAEAGYLTTNDPPQGELWIRGDAVTTGYFANPEETAAAIRDDGWFMTGDIAQFENSGLVKIIDRKKNLVKTLKGEYIALEKLESVYRASSLVANICVYAAPDQNQPVAIILPAEPALRKLAESNGIQAAELDELAANPKINELIVRDLQKVGRQAQLAGIELIEGIVLDTDEWTPQNGLLTAAQKIQRRKIFEKNRRGIDKAYGKP